MKNRKQFYFIILLRVHMYNKMLTPLKMNCKLTPLALLENKIKFLNFFNIKCLKFYITANVIQL